jgi:peptidoglycan/LPS O-acetylase OafA/YrhL
VPYRRDVEGLRALAVIAVIAYHLRLPGFGGGYVGVDIFFVISGFLITSLLITERLHTEEISLREFYARRIRRLLPISTVVLLVTALVGLLVINPLEWVQIGREIAASALLISNFEFASQGANYLTSTITPSPVQHYWSLSVEEQFYLLWPALILLGTTKARSVRTRVVHIATALVALSFTASVLLTPTQGAWSYFGLHTRGWELGLGALLAALSPHISRLPSRICPPMASLGLVGILVAILSFSETTVFPGSMAAIPVLGTVLILAAGIPRSLNPSTQSGPLRGPQWILERPEMQWAGSRSYSLYLWHWPVIILGQITLERHLPGQTWGALYALGAVALTVGLSEAGYRLIENPIRRSSALRLARGRSYALGLALIMAVLGTAGVLGTLRNDPTTGVIAATPASITATVPSTTPDPSTTPGPSTWAETTSPEAIHTGINTGTGEDPPHRALVELTPIVMSDTAPLPAVVTALKVTTVPDNLRPSLRQAAGDLGTAYTSGCQQYFSVSVPTNCVYGDPEGTQTMALWGDSHASQWFAALDKIARERNWRLLVVTQGGCPVIDVVTFNRQAGQLFTHCQPWRASVREYFRSENVDVVILSQYYALLNSSGQGAVPASAWSEHLPPLLDSLRADGIEPVIMGDTPDPSQVTPVCLADNPFLISVCNPGRGVRAERLRRVTAAIEDVATPRRISLIRPDRWLCVDDQCPVVIGNLLVYRDAHHLSNTIVEWLTPALSEILGPFLDAIEQMDK